MRVFFILLFLPGTLFCYGQGKKLHFQNEVGLWAALDESFRPTAGIPSFLGLQKGLPRFGTARPLPRSLSEQTVSWRYLQSPGNYFDLQIEIKDTSLAVTNNLSDAVFESERVLFYFEMESLAPKARLDTVSSHEVVRGIWFHTYEIRLSLNNKVLLTRGLYVSRMKDQYIQIDYYYTNEDSRARIRRMLDSLEPQY